MRDLFFNLKSKSIKLRLVEPEDADFILTLRLNDKYNNFLSAVDADVEKQRDWIRRYKEEERAREQFYFIIELHDGTPCGTVRVYDITDNSFTWGSWILNESKTRYSAIESALLVYELGFKILKLPRCHFEVMKANEKVIKFHKKLGSQEIGSDESFCYFEIFPQEIEKALSKFSHLMQSESTD